MLEMVAPFQEVLSVIRVRLLGLHGCNNFPLLKERTNGGGSVDKCICRTYNHCMKQSGFLFFFLQLIVKTALNSSFKTASKLEAHRPSAVVFFFLAKIFY